jgi:hypothetical protein
MSNSLYERDFYAWANEQASLLRAHRLSEVDLDNIAEEIESMGRSEKRELVSRLKVLLTHLLKWRYQPARRGNSWCLSIEEQRREVVNHLTDNPSLKVWLEDSMASAYGTAILVAARQTGLDRKSFPPVCPWTYQQIMDDAFWPDEEAQGSAP